MSEPLPTEQDFNDWRLHPVTKAVQELLRRWEEELKTRWAHGEFTDVSQYEAAIVNAKRVGQCEIIEHLKQLDYEQLTSELEDDDK